MNRRFSGRGRQPFQPDFCPSGQAIHLTYAIITTLLRQ